MAVVEDTIGKLTSGINFSGIGSTITILILVFIGAVVIGGAAYLLLMHRKFDRSIVVFEEIEGEPRITRRDKAMAVKIADDGQEILWLKKHKVHKPAVDSLIGYKQHAFQIINGYWYPVTFDTVRDKLGRIGLKPEIIDMRSFNQSTRKLIRDQHTKKSWLKEHLSTIMYAGLIAVTGVMMWLLFDKYLDIANSANSAIQASKEVLEATKGILNANNNILNGGSGLAPAP